mmetsp:Transcript_58297/g.167309  ORF Transcript_58297/g.167309 Transcript_58297/m.167309 type:complete len:223 (+) Transcript_58297:201-869(+)
MESESLALESLVSAIETSSSETLDSEPCFSSANLLSSARTPKAVRSSSSSVALLASTALSVSACMTAMFSSRSFSWHLTSSSPADRAQLLSSTCRMVPSICAMSVEAAESWFVSSTTRACACSKAALRLCSWPRRLQTWASNSSQDFCNASRSDRVPDSWSRFICTVCSISFACESAGSDERDEIWPSKDCRAARLSSSSRSACATCRSLARASSLALDAPS